MKVPVLLSPDMVEGIETILATRGKYTLDETLLFAVSNTGRSTTGWAALKKVVTKVPDLQHPELLTSTKLRKYLATMSQVRLNF